MHNHGARKCASPENLMIPSLTVKKVIIQLD